MIESVGQEIFNRSFELIKGKPFGYVIHPGPVETSEPFWGLAPDKKDKYCSYVLIKFLGSPLWIRQRNELIRFFPENS